MLRNKLVQFVNYLVASKAHSLALCLLNNMAKLEQLVGNVLLQLEDTPFA